MSQTRFVCITGPSGSGKSSLARAGLIHQLKQGGLDGSANWLYEAFTPQGNPLTQLANALARLTRMHDTAGRFLRTNKENPNALDDTRLVTTSVNQTSEVSSDANVVRDDVRTITASTPCVGRISSCWSGRACRANSRARSACNT